MPICYFSPNYPFTFFKQCTSTVLIVYTLAVACIRKGLTREASQQNIKIRNTVGINISNIFQQTLSTIVCQHRITIVAALGIGIKIVGKYYLCVKPFEVASEEGKSTSKA